MDVVKPLGGLLRRLVMVASSLAVLRLSTCLSCVFVAGLSQSLYFVSDLSLYMSKNVGIILM